MTDREKLTELLEQWMQFETAENHADYLLANGVTVQKWIPVSERLPDMELEAVMVEDMDLFPCLVCKNVTIPRKRKLVTKAWYDGKGFVDMDCMDITDETTHWMPLPEPPKEDAK